MKKKIFPILLFAIALLASGCSCSNRNNSGSDEIIGHVDDITRYEYQGTHDFNCRETNDFIVKNKITNYKIVLPHASDSYIINAKEELSSLFKEATGIEMECITEDDIGLIHSPENEYISIGDTNLFLTSGLTFDKHKLGQQGVKILTKDKTIFLQGGSTHGCIYAVYDLLELLFDFDTFSYDCIHLSKKEDVRFYEMDITDIPDIDIRANSWGFIKENPNNIAYRLRTPYIFDDYILFVGDTDHGAKKATIHSSLDIIPKQFPSGYEYCYEDLNEWDKNWFSDAGDQICYTAHGNPDSYERLLNKAARVIEQSLMFYKPKDYPLKNYVTFTMEDNHDICHCESCIAKRELYGEEVGAVITFCNDLMERISSWMNDKANKEYYREGFKLLFFAYNSFLNAPAHLDESSGKYVVNHPDLVMREDVGVYYAISSGIQYQLSIYDERNADGIINYLKWSDIASSTHLWTYNANFGHYLCHVNSTNFYNSDAYQLFANRGTKSLYNQGGWNTYNLTAFQMLAIYLDAKLSWNSNLDINKLIDKWFEYMFKDASNEMKELFYAENLYSLILFEKIGKLANSGIINVSVATQDCWPYQMLVKWLGYIDKARERIEIYKEIDPDTYYMLKEHIDLEWVSPAYYIMSLYGSDYMPQEMYQQYVNYFYYEILPLKYFLVSERSESLSVWILSLMQ